MPGDDPETPGVDESGGVDSVADVAASGQSTEVGEGAGDYYDPFSVTTEGSDPTIKDFVDAELNPKDLGVTPTPGGPLGGGNLGDPDPVSGGIGSLIDKVTPDGPDLMTILTAPLEALISFFTFGLVDPEFTGKDVFGIPGASSSDFSRAMEGKEGPQPVGVEVGLPMIGGFEWSPGSDARGTGIFAGDKEAQFSMDPNQPSKSVPTDMLSHFTEIIAKSDAPTDMKERAAERVNAAANLATNYQQMDLGAEEAKTAAQYMDQARNEAPTFAPSTPFDARGMERAKAGGATPVAQAGAWSPGVGAAPVASPAFDVEGMERANQEFSQPGTLGSQPGYSPGVQGRIPGRSSDPKSAQYKGDKATLGEFPVGTAQQGTSPSLLDPTIGAREKLASEAIMRQMVMQPPSAYRDMPASPLGGYPHNPFSVPYDPINERMVKQAAAKQAIENAYLEGKGAAPYAGYPSYNLMQQAMGLPNYGAPGARYGQGTGTQYYGYSGPPVSLTPPSTFGVASPHATVQAYSGDPRIQASGAKTRAFLSDLWSRISGGKAGGGAVRGPVTGGQRSRGIMSLR